MESPDQLAMSEVKIEIDVAEEAKPPWMTLDQCSGPTYDRSENNVSTAITPCDRAAYTRNSSAAAIKSEPDAHTDCGPGIKAEIKSESSVYVVLSEPVTTNTSNDKQTEAVTDVMKRETCDAVKSESTSSRDEDTNRPAGENQVKGQLFTAKMAAQRTYSLREAIELVTEEGSDIELDLLGTGDEFSDDFFDDDDTQFVPDDDFESDEESLLTDPYDDETELDSNTSDGHTAKRDDLMTVDIDDEDQEYMYEWVKDLTNFPLAAPFTGTPGLSLPADFPDTPTPVDFYRLIVDKDLIKLFKTETNRYARETCARKQATGQQTPRSIFRTWKPVTVDEMTRFVAILIHMGLIKKTKITDYWSTDPSLHTEFASRLLKRERFRSILAFFHLNDNNNFIPRGKDGHDPLYKIRPFFDHVLQKLGTLYMPEEEICIDEAICPWRGQSSLRVCMRDKSIKWGLKLYELCESSSGYVVNLEVMCHSPGVSNTPFDVCMRLLEPLNNLGHTLYVDSYYCSPLLAETLSVENTQVVGPVCSNRVGLPKDLVQQPMAKGDVDYRRKNQTIFLRWKDKRDVFMLSTKHLPTMQTVRSKTEVKKKPVCVVDYIHNMAGVDKSDQMISYLPLHRKTVKWWKKLAFHLLTLSMIQSHILYNKHRKLHHLKAIHLDAFVKSVVKNFAAELAPEDDPQPSTSGAAHPDTGADMGRLRPGSHWPANIPPIREQQTRKTQRGCKVCYAKLKAKGASRQELKNSKKATTIICKQCKVPLCGVPCFELFHTSKDYSK